MDIRAAQRIDLPGGCQKCHGQPIFGWSFWLQKERSEIFLETSDQMCCSQYQGQRTKPIERQLEIGQLDQIVSEIERTNVRQCP